MIETVEVGEACCTINPYDNHTTIMFERDMCNAWVGQVYITAEQCHSLRRNMSYATNSVF